MLKSLSIENYALIKQLHITPNDGLNMITGETGAGKSIMLGAIGLLLGQRADTKVLFDSAKKCIIEASFDISAYRLVSLFEEFDIDFEEECLVRREINANGKSRAFVNDCLTNLDFLKRLGARLMDVHSQHETLRLAQKSYQLEVIDTVAQNHKTLQEFKALYADYLEKDGIYKSLIQESDEMRKEADYHQFLFEELDKAQLQSDEQEALESKLNKLENAEEIKSRLFDGLNLADRSEMSILNMLNELKSSLNQISRYGENYEALRQRIDSLEIELKDIVSELENEEDGVAYDPERTQEVQERLDLIYKLLQKHQAGTIDELIQVYEELGNKVLRVSNLDEAIDEAQKVADRAYALAEDVAQKLSKKRQSTFNQFAKETTQLLSSLGMPNSTISLKHGTTELSVNGIDEIDILFSANKGIDPQPLKQAASGGEFSRLMFSIKYILADKTALPTVVFDEIDTGISGEIAIKMAEMMKEMAKNHQVITITHLPQIAAKGEAHYFVYKDDSSNTTSSQIKLLNEEERLTEIAEMIGGKQATATAIDSAKELMRS
ncbi:DNA repair protein RecN [Roseivirga misakiensis]|uniref:DNA repair protein RecN n=1 Tax=Roseivirga misakiensis TaxID=1563681 RepID=A0A1E5T0Y2_9BACT|nr:DNA repair protein RecN [Roseivirga misakiensis]OEK05042.1 DNA repair protein RecN [Roseivirga misakiensis]